MHGTRPKSEIADGMQIEWDVPIEMDDGLVLRADVFRPPAAGRYPVILSYGPYGKGLAFAEGWKNAWQRLSAMHPNVTEGTSTKYANFEVVDPEQRASRPARVHAHDGVAVRAPANGRYSYRAPKLGKDRHRHA
jgi:hypothetical protein